MSFDFSTVLLFMVAIFIGWQLRSIRMDLKKDLDGLTVEQLKQRRKEVMKNTFSELMIFLLVISVLFIFMLRMN